MPNLNNLTAKQKKIYSIIEAFIKSNGIPPTVREIGELAGEKTPGAIQGILNRLEEKGAIKRQVGMARSIQLVKNSSIYCDKVFIPEVKRINQRNSNDIVNIYNIVRYHPMSNEFCDEGKDIFAAEPPEDSCSFDTTAKKQELLFICRDEDLNDGDIVVVQYKGHIFLRKYYHTDNKDLVLLKGDNNIIAKEEFHIDEVVIVGKVAGRFIKY